MIDIAVRPPRKLSISPAKQGGGFSWSRPRLPKLDLKHFNWVLIAAIVLPLLAPASDALLNYQRYQVVQAKGFLPKTTPKQTAKLAYDKGKQAYLYNGGAEAKTPSDGANVKIGDKDGNFYSATLPSSASAGITIKDTQNDVSVTMTPRFAADSAKVRDGRVVYPVSGQPAQIVYTPEVAGLKEDLVLKAAPGNTASYAYEIKLPSSLEARMVGGALGIYGVDPVLLGNISYGSDADKQTVEQARKNGKKDHLMFLLPAPVIKQANGKVSPAKASFNYSGGVLTVTASSLKQASYPLTIDPSFLVSSAASMTQGNIDSGIDFDTSSSLIKRGGLTGGSAGTWSATTAMANLESGTAVAYNGYLYMVGGYDGTSLHNDVRYNQITNGTLGASWTTSGNTFTTARSKLTAVIYNGYMYVMGGCTTSSCGSTLLNDVQYAKVNSDGSIGSWNSGNSFTTARYAQSGVAYNGYLYVMGGCTQAGTNADWRCASGVFLNDVQYAPIKGDGSIGTWNTTSAFTTARGSFGAVAYNGYLYLIGGEDFAILADVQYVPIKSDGTLGTWQATTSLPAGRSNFVYFASNGYLYTVGGCGAVACGSASDFADAQYAPINADGTVGAWNAGSNTFTNKRGRLQGAVYGGYVFVVTGISGNTYYNDAQSAKIDPVGNLRTPSWTSTTSATNSWWSGVAVYNGWVYKAGGCNNGTSSNLCNHTGGNLQTVQYAQINASTGALGSWTTDATHTMVKARTGGTAVVYNGYLYLIGGMYNSGASDLIANTVESAQLSQTGGLSTGFTEDATHTLAVGRLYQGSVVYNGKLFVFGGCTGLGAPNCNAQTNTVEWTALTSTGGLGSWTTDSTAGHPLTTARYGLTAVVNNDYVYIVGGIDSTGILKEVRHAQLNPSGGLSSGWTSDNSFATSRAFPSVGASNGMLYVAGGCSAWPCSNASTILTSVESVPFTGTSPGIGTWGTQTALTAGYVGGALVVWYNGYVQEISGCAAFNASFACSTSTAQASYYNQFGNGGLGKTGTSANLTNSFATARAAHSTIAYNGFLYVIGGCTAAVTGSCSARQTDVQYSAIGADGTLGTWASTSSFATGRFSQAAAAYNGYMYVIGGCSNTTNANASHCTAFRDDVQFALICTGSNNGVSGCGSTAGTLGTWNYTHSSTNDGATFVSGILNGRWGLSVEAYNGYIYIIGGCGGTANSGNYCDVYENDVQYAPLNSDGTVGTWHYTHNSTDDGATFSAGFTTARTQHSTVVYNGYIYLLGGCSASNSGCSTELNDVQYAPLNTNGTIGSWTGTTNLQTARFGHTSVAANGFIYVIGGCTNAITTRTCSVMQSDIEYASIGVGGTLSQWMDAGSFTTGRFEQGTDFYNGRLYVTGGCSASTVQTIPHCTTYQGDSQDAGQQAIPRIGNYSKVIDLLTDQTPDSLVFRGTGAGTPEGDSSIVSVGWRAATSGNVAFGNLGSSGRPAYQSTVKLSSLDGSGVDRQQARYVSLFFKIDDSQTAPFPDTSSTISAFELYYHPNTGEHLLNGRHFNNGVLQSLDTPPT